MKIGICKTVDRREKCRVAGADYIEVSNAKYIIRIDEKIQKTCALSTLTERLNSL